MNKEKIKIWLPLLLSLSMIAGMFIGYKIRDSIPGRNFFSIDSRKPIQEIFDLIENKYVDKVDVNKLTDTAIQAILQKLDPHSVYIPASDLEDINNDINGSFFGIGIEFDMYNDTLHVVHVLENGPAKKAGLLKGDLIIKANDKNIAGKKLQAEDIRKIIRGNQGTKLNILTIRNGRQINFTVSRDFVPVSSIEASYMIDNNTGFIKINKFSTQTYREFMTAITELKKKGLQKLILDLRDNGGGVLDEAVEIADEFLDGDKLITYTEGLHMPKKEYRCRRTGQFEKGKLIVLSNEGSASASEILMGALQEWDRATIIGRRSFGKGLVQEQFDLSDHSALRLTIGRYYTPLGRSIQRSYANGEKAYYQEIENRIVTDTFALLIKSKAYTTPAGKKVFGGGGISPDYIINTDSMNYYSSAINQLISKGIINHFGYYYSLSNFNNLKSYQTAKDFANQFSVTENIWKEFSNFALNDSVSITGFSENDKRLVKQSIKYNIARNNWNDEAYIISLNNDDNTVKKAIELIKQ